MASINKISLGQYLYKTYKRKMGNTTMLTTEISTYQVVRIDHDSKSIHLKSFISQREFKCNDSQLKGYYVTKPTLKESFTGAKYIVSARQVRNEKALKDAEIDLRKCDGCGVDSDSVEQSSCLTSHLDEDSYSFKFEPCPNDFFYCKKCMNNEGFCNDCNEVISRENQQIIIKNFA